MGRIIFSFLASLPLAAGLPVLVPVVPDAGSIAQNDTKSVIDDVEPSTLPSASTLTEPTSTTSTYIKYPPVSIDEQLATWPWNPWEHEPDTTTVYELWWDIASTHTMTISPAFETGDYTVLVQTPPASTDWVLSRYWAKVPIYTHDDEIPPQPDTDIRTQVPDIVFGPDHQKRELTEAQPTTMSEDLADAWNDERAPSRKKRPTPTRSRRPFTFTTVTYHEHHTTRTTACGKCSSPKSTDPAVDQYVQLPDSVDSAAQDVEKQRPTVPVSDGIDGAGAPVEVPNPTVVPTKAITDAAGDLLDTVTTTLAVQTTGLPVVPNAEDALDDVTINPKPPVTETVSPTDSIPAADTVVPNAEDALNDVTTTPTLPLTRTVPLTDNISAETIVPEAGKIVDDTAPVADSVVPAGEDALDDAKTAPTVPLTETVPLTDSSPVDTIVPEAGKAADDLTATAKVPLTETAPLTGSAPAVETDVAENLPLGDMVGMIGDDTPAESMSLSTTPLTATVPLTETAPVGVVPLTSLSPSEPTKVVHTGAIDNQAGSGPTVTKATTPLTIEVSGVTTVTVSTDALSNVPATNPLETVAQIDTSAASLPATVSSSPLPPVVPDVTKSSASVPKVTVSTDALGGVVPQSSTTAAAVNVPDIVSPLKPTTTSSSSSVTTTSSGVVNVPQVDSPVTTSSTPATSPASPTATSATASTTAAPVLNVPAVDIVGTTTSSPTTSATSTSSSTTTASSPIVNVAPVVLTTTTTTRAPTTSTSTTPLAAVPGAPKVGVRALTDASESSAPVSSTPTTASTQTLQVPIWDGYLSKVTSTATYAPTTTEYVTIAFVS